MPNRQGSESYGGMPVEKVATGNYLDYTKVNSGFDNRKYNGMPAVQVQQPSKEGKEPQMLPKGAVNDRYMNR